MVEFRSIAILNNSFQLVKLNWKNNSKRKWRCSFSQPVLSAWPTNTLELYAGSFQTHIIAYGQHLVATRSHIKQITTIIVRTTSLTSYFGLAPFPCTLPVWFGTWCQPRICTCHFQLVEVSRAIKCQHKAHVYAHGKTKDQKYDHSVPAMFVFKCSTQKETHTTSSSGTVCVTWQENLTWENAKHLGMCLFENRNPFFKVWLWLK